MDSVEEALPAKRSVGGRLLAHGGVYTAAQLTNHALVFLLLPLYAQKLGSHGLGVIEMTNAARRVMCIVFLQGLGIAWFRLRHQHKDPAERRTFEATIVWYLLFSSMALVGLFTLFSEQVTRFIMPGIPFFPLGLLTLIAAAAIPQQILLERTLQAQQRAKQLAAFSVARTLLTLTTILCFVVGLERGAAGKVEAEAIAAVLLALTALVWLRPAPPTQASPTQLKAALAYGVPQIPQGLAGVVNDMVDRVLLGAALGLTAVGVYSVGYRVAGIGMLLMGAMHQAFSPMFVDDLHEAEEKEKAGDAHAAKQLRENLALGGLGMVVLACVLAQGITATGREVMALLTPMQVNEAYPVLGPVSMSVVAWCCHAIFVQSIFYEVRAGRVVALIGVIGAASNIVANLVLIPWLGMMGAAWATLASNTFYAVLSHRAGMHFTPIPYAFQRWLRVFAWTGLSLVAFYLCDASSLTTWARVTAKLVLLSISLSVTAALSGVTLGTLRALRARLRTDSIS